MTDYTVLIAGISAMLLLMILGIISLIPSHSVHPLGLNVSHINETVCRYTWLGGIDYDSFVENLSVNGVDIGHPGSGTVIHTGNCSTEVKMFMRDVKTYMTIWPNREVKNGY